MNTTQSMVQIPKDEWLDIKKRMADLERANALYQLQLTKAQGEHLLDANIKEILANMDFDKIHTAMTALDWQWDSIKAVPNTAQLREGAVSIMRQALRGAKDTGGEYYTGTGGFWATAYEDGTMKLEFILDEWNTGD